MSCPHGLPDRRSCVECLDDDMLGGDLERDPLSGPSVIARFESRCRECGSTIFVGDVVARVGDAWIHDRCPSRRVADVASPEPIPVISTVIHYASDFLDQGGCW